MADGFFADSAPSTWVATTLGEVVRREAGRLDAAIAANLEGMGYGLPE